MRVKNKIVFILFILLFGLSVFPGYLAAEFAKTSGNVLGKEILLTGVVPGKERLSLVSLFAFTVGERLSAASLYTMTLQPKGLLII